MADNWYQGNATDENDQYRGWLLGHFINGEDPTIRKTEALVVKWGIHKASEQRSEWTTGEDRTTLFMLSTLAPRPHRRHLHPQPPRRLHRLGTRHRPHLASPNRQHRPHHPLAIHIRITAPQTQLPGRDASGVRGSLLARLSGVGVETGGHTASATRSYSLERHQCPTDVTLGTSGRASCYLCVAPSPTVAALLG
jgi:hypothetical protein